MTAQGGALQEARIASSCEAQESESVGYRYDTLVDVASNKTLIGVGEGHGATSLGARFGVGASSQVIIRNLEIRDVNPQLIGAGSGIILREASHVWSDHVRFGDIGGGYVDTGAADHSASDRYVTLCCTGLVSRANA